jgi:hypothetical protein
MSMKHAKGLHVRKVSLSHEANPMNCGRPKDVQLRSIHLLFGLHIHGSKHSILSNCCCSILICSDLCGTCWWNCLHNEAGWFWMRYSALDCFGNSKRNMLVCQDRAFESCGLGVCSSWLLLVVACVVLWLDLGFRSHSSVDVVARLHQSGFQVWPHRILRWRCKDCSPWWDRWIPYVCLRFRIL